MAHPLDRCSTHLKRVLSRAVGLVPQDAHVPVTPLHLLLAIAMERGSTADEVLSRVHLTPEVIRNALDRSSSPPPRERSEGGSSTPALSTDARRAIEKAALTAATHEHRYIGTEHLLTGLLDTGDAAVRALLQERGIDPQTITQHLAIVHRSATKFPELTADLLERRDQAGTPEDGSTPAKTPALEFFAKDLTAPATTAKLDPVIGRAEEIDRVIQILCRRTKNNPLLVGEPGVGKTAIVEGLAKKIAARDVPDVLVGKRILALDLSLIVAGTIYRGEFESRLKQILDEVRQDANLILFIDEVHMIMGAGAASGSLDAANILKPALAKGELRCIGATTYTEFKKHVENDPALERRFQSVHVAEPSPEATAEILRGLKPHYEAFHELQISDAAINAAVRYAERYLSDRRFPDKAIDLLDEAAARARVQLRNDPLLRSANTASAALEDVETRKRQSVAEERFMDAAAMQREANRLRRAVTGAHGKLRRRRTKDAHTLGEQDIAAVVAQIIGRSSEEILLNERERFRVLGDRLRERIVGQEEAITAVTAALQRASSGMASPKRPLASFLLLGPTGVGKTETARVIADLLFTHRDSLIRLDMSEYSEGFTVSKLIGAPAGYVGYREGSKLTDAVRKRPASVVLFDEIEKAHPDVWNLLLQILEDGRITDATGRETSFTNTVVVLTSNIGAAAFTTAGIGFASGVSPAASLDARFADIRQDALRELQTRFRPELLNRIDATVVYRPLGKEHLAAIAATGIAEIAARLLEQHRITLSATPAVAGWVADRAFDPASGARAVRRVLQEHVEHPLATGILERRFSPEHVVMVTVANDATTLCLTIEERASTESLRPVPA